MAITYEINSNRLQKDIKNYVLLQTDAADKDDVNNWKRDQTGRIIVNEKSYKEFIPTLHTKYGHNGITSMYYNLRDVFYIKNLQKIIKDVVFNCMKCYLCKWNKDTSYYRTNKHIVSDKPFYKVCTDIFGPFVLDNLETHQKSTKGYIITVTDIYSRYSKVKFVQKISSREVINFLQLWFSETQIPSYILSDNGKQYRSKFYMQFLKAQGCIPIYIPAYAPFSNGISERINTTISELLLIYKNEPISKICEIINHKLNNSYHRTLGKSPNEIINGHNFYDSAKVIGQTKIIRTEIDRDLGNSDHKNIKIDDYVFIKNTKSGKLEQRYRGPFRVVNVGGKGRWIKVECNAEWIHVRNLKLWRGADCGMSSDGCS